MVVRTHVPWYSLQPVHAHPLEFVEVSETPRTIGLGLPLQLAMTCDVISAPETGPSHVVSSTRTPKLKPNTVHCVDVSVTRLPVEGALVSAPEDWPTVSYTNIVTVLVEVRVAREGEEARSAAEMMTATAITAAASLV